MDQGAMAMNGHFALTKAQALLEPHHQIVLCHIQDIRWRGLTPMKNCIWCILQPQPTGLDWSVLERIFDQVSTHQALVYPIIH